MFQVGASCDQRYLHVGDLGTGPVSYTHLDVYKRQQFSNGYTFESAVPVNYETSDKDGNKLGKGIHLNITYGKEGMEPITFSAEVGLDGGSAPTDVKTCGDGTELRFYKTVNKFVPANYELTEEDKKAQEAGIFDLAYGLSLIHI